MAYVTKIGSNPEQIEYRLGKKHGCSGPGDRQFSYHADGRERPLRWIGRALADLGIEAGSELTEDQFDQARALMRGEHPMTGEVLVEAKRGVPSDAKVAVAPLVRAVHGVAAEAAVSVAEVLGNRAKLVTAFAAAERAVTSKGEAARLRADEAGVLADAAGVDVEQVWGEQVYARAAANLWQLRKLRRDDGTVGEERVPRRVVVGNLGYDITMTLPKSFSLLLALGDEELAADIERVYTEQVQALFGWLENTTAYGMRGKHGGGRQARVVHGNGFAGWLMVHRAARPVDGAEIGDPHWHVHATIANMTRGEDGQWSTVAAGGRDLMRHAAALDHMFKATVRHELGRRYGIRFERNPRTRAWEIVGIPDETLQLFSKRHADIKDMLERLGYDANTATRAQYRIAEQRSRGAKGEAVAAPDATLQQLWHGEELAAGRDPAEHIRRVLNGGADPDPVAGPATSPTGPSSPSTGARGARPRDDGDLDDEQLDALADALGGADPGADVAADAVRTYPAASHVAAAAAGAATVDAAEIAEMLLDPETGLTSDGRRFTRAEALARVADAMPGGFATTAEIEEMTDRVLSIPGFRQLRRGPGQQHMSNAVFHTTDDVVSAEQQILRAARASYPGQSDVRVIDEELIQLAVNTVEAQQGFALSEEQTRALRRVVGQGRLVDTVNGAPGTGKTTLMRAVRVVFEAAGYVVGGAATAAVAAQNLQAEAGIPARTVASYLARIRNNNAASSGANDGDGIEVFAGVDVLIVDEANLTEDRSRAALYRAAARSGTRIVEIGDRKQLRGVGVGSLFARVHEIVEGAELRDNRRQREEDEREAIAAWRDARYVEALSIWQDKARLVVRETGREANAEMLARWWDQHQGAPNPHTEMRGLVMLAATNAQVRRLNQAAQALREAEGELGASWTYNVAGDDRITLHVGDHILLRVNDARQQRVEGDAVYNGFRAVVTDIDARGTLSVAWEQDTADGVATRTARLSTDYVAIGGVHLGYALTVHKAEGLTIKVNGPEQWNTPDGEDVDGTVLVHAPGADNPALHVATSRHRGAVWLFAGRDELDTPQDSYLHGVPKTRAERDWRAMEQLAEHARRTETHRNDRPVVADLGLAEFVSEDGRAQFLHAQRAAEAEAAERVRDEQRAERAERAARRAARRAEREQQRQAREAAEQARREWAAALLQQVWRHEPSLVERIIAGAAFAAVARNLDDAAQAGFDVHEVLADIPLDAVGSPRVTDASAYTARMVDIAVEHVRNGDTAQQRRDEAEQRSAKDQQAREQAAELLRELWSARPQLAEKVVAAPGFEAVVRALDRYVDTDLDVRDLLAAMPLAKLDAPQIREPAAFSAYMLRRVGDAQLEAIERARVEAEERTERLARTEHIADLLRAAWPSHTQVAERTIANPTFTFLVERAAAAEEAGHDVQAVLAGIDPRAVNGPRVQNPAGALTMLFTRAVDRIDRDIEPREVEAHQPVPSQPEQRGASPALEPAALPALSRDLEVDGPQPDHVVESGAETRSPPVEHWTQRPHGALSARELRAHLAHEQQRADALAADRAGAEQRAEQLRRAVEAGHGTEVAAVEQRLAQAREQALAVRGAGQLEAAWHAATERAGRAAEDRALAEHEFASHSRLARSRRAEIAERIDQLRAAELQAHTDAEQLAQQVAQAQAQAGPRDQHRHILTRAEAAEKDHAHAREAAQRRDQEVAEAAYRRAARLTEQQLTHTQRIAELQAEHDLRERQPPELHALEEQQRTTALQPAALAPHIGEIETGGREITSPDVQVLDAGHLEATQPHPHEIDRHLDPGLDDR
ncbi:conjugative relaxase-like TrwC/TraI family protein [Pseudonocardia kunmingensis]|uniref:Conjugative relaxase-like TrwC/TraI family protein n=1 Tax=Pseudonocardia kunmingensis TaxID=630975 RepID=A0A543CX57_9PSEU|nr:conjugative relaxase-like TrwC/TraI family protein [Pseudonocardia kunmingensis]